MPSMGDSPSYQIFGESGLFLPHAKVKGLQECRMEAAPSILSPKTRRLQNDQDHVVLGKPIECQEVLHVDHDCRNAAITIDGGGL